MGLTYFKRYRMQLDLRQHELVAPELPPHYELLDWNDSLLRQHAAAKYESFRLEMDAYVFPCLGRREGCLRLMRDISRRGNFVPEATWLIRAQLEDGQIVPVGTVQGLRGDGYGSIQNLGIAAAHRGSGLGTILLARAAAGFVSAGIARMQLEVTSDNTAAVRLYKRLGFRTIRTVFKAADVAYA